MVFLYLTSNFSTLKLKDLDHTLESINKTNILFAISFTEIYNPNTGLTKFEQELCLMKLVKDGFADLSYEMIVNNETQERTPDLNNKRYNITYDGFIFLNNGGYKADATRKWYSYVITKIEVWAVILAGGLAAVYYSVELYRFFYSLFHAPPTSV